MKKIFGSLIILVMLSGCWCGIEEKDPSGVPDYFSGCWSKLKGEKTKASGN
ncbi:MAG: hypothetical protein ABL867_08370 [Rickettsiales bacterium]